MYLKTPIPGPIFLKLKPSTIRYFMIKLLISETLCKNGHNQNSIYRYIIIYYKNVLLYFSLIPVYMILLRFKRVIKFHILLFKVLLFKKA